MSDEKRIATGGRSVIHADGTSEYIRYYDQPLTKEEQAATEWFHILSPNEQYREVRRMKWNLEVARKDAETWKELAQKYEQEALIAQAKLRTYTPEGFTLPASVGELFELASQHGWRTSQDWTVDEDDETSALIRIALRNDQWTIKLTWSADKGGGARRTRAGLIREYGRQWRDAPSVKAIKKLIEGK